MAPGGVPAGPEVTAGSSRTMTQNHTKEEERRIREAALDKTLADSFPASDPPSTLPNPEDDSVAESRA
jgi:hypothetical protein